MPCLLAKAFAESRDLAAHASTFAVGNSLSAWVKSCEILPHPMRPHRRGGHSRGFDTDGSSSGEGGWEIVMFYKELDGGVSERRILESGICFERQIRWRQIMQNPWQAHFTSVKIFFTHTKLMFAYVPIARIIVASLLFTRSHPVPGNNLARNALGQFFQVTFWTASALFSRTRSAGHPSYYYITPSHHHIIFDRILINFK